MMLNSWMAVNPGNLFVIQGRFLMLRESRLSIEQDGGGAVKWMGQTGLFIKVQTDSMERGLIKQGPLTSAAFCLGRGCPAMGTHGCISAELWQEGLSRGPGVCQYSQHGRSAVNNIAQRGRFAISHGRILLLTAFG